MIRFIPIIWIILLFLSCSNAPLESKQKEIRFSLIPAEQSGVTFVNALDDNPKMNILRYQYYYNGGGVAVGDINNDGLQDLYFTANYGPNGLYLNKGNFTFEEITRSANVAGSRGWATGVQMIDINNDGYLDIYVCRSGRFDDEQRRNKLFMNNGDLTFTDKAKEYGLDDNSFSIHSSFFDFDRDGDLDMYLLNHNYEIEQNYNITDRSVIHPYYGDKLFENKNGKFVDITQKAGIYATPIGYGLGLSTIDFNNDGWLDIYICNDFLEHDYLYINQHDGTFKEELKAFTYHISNFSMGLDAGDINNDGWMDIMVADMAAEDNYRQKANMSGMNPKKFYRAVEEGFHYQYMFNTLQLNNGNGSFSEIGQLAGVASTDWSWATLMADFDNDGFKDIFITNGLRKDMKNKDFVNYRNSIQVNLASASEEEQDKIIMDLLAKMPSQKLKNFMFRNSGNLRFENITDAWGLDQPSFSNGAAYADLDNDGDLDLVTSNVDEPPFIYENLQEGNNYLRVKLKGPTKNVMGLGSRVSIDLKGKKQWADMQVSRGYQSSIEPYIHFGLGENTDISNIQVIWPDGKEQTINNPDVNTVIEIFYSSDLRAGIKETFKTQYSFKDISNSSNLSDVRHHENAYDDFAREILLPHSTSKYGPALATSDVNGDGLDDIFLGGAKGFSAQLLIQSADGTFTSVSKDFQNEAEQEDVDALFFDADSDGDEDLYVVSGGNEFEINDKLLKDRLYLNTNGEYKYAPNALPAFLSSGGVVKSSDIDNDGDRDLFIGSRLVPGRYPYPADSYILINEKGTFYNGTAQWCNDLTGIGMISSAVWMDIDSDGVEDLIIAGEWTPIITFVNKGNRLERVEQSGFENSEGWWFHLGKGDYDKDGDMDLIAGNLGENYKFKASEENPFKVYCNDFDENGSLDIVLSYYQKGEYFPVRGRQCSSEQMPFISEKFEDYHGFASSNMTEIYTEEALDAALSYEAKTFSSYWFENRNGQFIRNKLPALAQISNINTSILADLDKNGDEELLIAGNFYESEVETPRNDASIGLLMQFKNSNWEAVEPYRSGFTAEGNVRKMAIVKLPKGEIGIVIARNNDRLSILKP